MTNTRAFGASRYNGVPLRFSNLHTQKWFTQGETRINGDTVNNMLTSESSPIAARFLFANRSTVETDVCGFDKVSISPTSAINDGFTPQNASGANDNTMWVPLTFDNGGAIPALFSTDYADTINRGGARLNFNAAPPLDISVNSSYIEKVVASDLVPIKSLARLDSPSVNLPLFCLRGYSAGFVPVTSNTGMLADWATNDLGRTYKSYYKFGDCVTTPANFTSPTSADYVISAGVQFLYENRGLQILQAGDSTAAGDWDLNTSGGHQGGVRLACAALSTPSFPITLCQLARSGSRQPSFSRQLRNYIDVVRPDIVFLQGFSVNNTVTVQSNVDDAINAAFSDAKYCAERGCIPVIVIPPPWGYTSTSYTTFLAMVTAFQTAAPNFALIADCYTPLNDPNNLGFPLAGSYAAAAAYHPLYATQQMLSSAVFQPIMQKIMARRPQA